MNIEPRCSSPEYLYASSDGSDTPGSLKDFIENDDSTNESISEGEKSPVCRKRKRHYNLRKNTRNRVREIDDIDFDSPLHTKKKTPRAE